MHEYRDNCEVRNVDMTSDEVNLGTRGSVTTLKHFRKRRIATEDNKLTQLVLL